MNTNRRSLRRTSALAALAVAAGALFATAPFVVASPDSSVGQAVVQKAEAYSYGWGPICYTYRTPIVNGKYTVYTYRIFTSSTGSYCAHYSTHTVYTKTW